MVKNPVCGMEVVPEEAEGKSTYKGEIIYFCSLRCKESFDKNPETILTGVENVERQVLVSEGGVIYTCPMHPEIRQEGPGVCPKCGMVLELTEPSFC